MSFTVFYCTSCIAL